MEKNKVMLDASAYSAYLRDNEDVKRAVQTEKLLMPLLLPPPPPPPPQISPLQLTENKNYDIMPICTICRCIKEAHDGRQGRQEEQR